MKSRFLPLLCGLSMLMQTGCAPVINDITTNPDSPVPIYADGQEISYPSSFAEKQRASYPELAPMQSELSQEELFRKLSFFVEDHPSFSRIERRDSDFHLQAVATTPWLRFKDDVAFQVRLGAAGGVELHMRSRSRLGKGDFGTNAKRITKSLSQFQLRLKQEGTAR